MIELIAETFVCERRGNLPRKNDLKRINLKETRYLLFYGSVMLGMVF
jgi:hypothetical protein